MIANTAYIQIYTKMEYMIKVALSIGSINTGLETMTIETRG